MSKHIYKFSALVLVLFLITTGCDRRIISSQEEQDQTLPTVASVHITPMEPLLFVDTTDVASAVDTLQVLALDVNSTAIAGVEVDVRLVDGSEGALYPATADTVTNHQGQIQYVYQAVEGMDIEDGGIISIMAQAGNAVDTTRIELCIQETNSITIIQPLGETLYTDPSNTDETEVRALLTIEGHAAPNMTVYFGATLGYITGSEVTDAQGIATAFWISPIDTGYCEISASYGNLEDTRNYHVLMGVGEAASIVLESEYAELPQGEIISSVITASVFDPLSNPVEAGTNVRFASTLGGLTEYATTDDNGQCTTVFQMGTSSGLAEITAWVNVGTDSVYANTFIMLNAGIPANIVLSANNPVIEIMGSGAMSTTPVHAEVLDPSGYAVTEETDVAFSIVSAPDSVSMSVAGDETRYWYRAISGTSDTLIVNTTNGMATISVNSWKRPGVVMIQAYVVEYPEVLSQRALITVVSGPPTHGYVDRNAVGVQIGAGMWEIEWAAHFWDLYSNDVRDSTAVYFHVEPEYVCSIGGDAFTGNENNAGETHPGIAFTNMIYSSGTIGDTLFLVEACCAGLVPEDPEDPESPYIPGDLCVPYDAPFYILPFQPGDLGQNLIIQGDTDYLIYQNPGIPPGPLEFQDVPMTALIIDGYGNPVHNQIIVFSCSAPAQTEWDPPDGSNFGISNDQGVVQKILRVYQDVCENMWVYCGITEDYYQFAPYTHNVWATQLPDMIQSNQWTITCTTPCPGE